MTKLPEDELESELEKADIKLETMQSAYDQCLLVNKDNPLAVAGAIKEAFEALKEITELAPRETLRLPYAIQAVEIADRVLAKAKKKGE